MDQEQIRIGVDRDILRQAQVAYVDALVLGLSGACWLITARSHDHGEPHITRELDQLMSTNNKAR